MIAHFVLMAAAPAVFGGTGAAQPTRDLSPAPKALRVFFTNHRAVPIGIVDYGHHAIDPDLNEFIADNYDLIASGDQNLNFTFYRTHNPDIRIYSYFNSFMLGLDQPAPSDERAYLHDGSVPVDQHNAGNRLGKNFENNFHYVMDPSSPQWQTFALAEIRKVLGNGFDGVLIDDVFAHLMHEAHFNADEPLLIGTPSRYTAFSTAPAWYDPQASHDGWRSLLGLLDHQLAGEVLYNGINDLAENNAPIDPALHPADYLNVSDGSIQEGFVYNSKWTADPNDAFLGDEYWQATVRVLMDIPTDKRHGVVSYGAPDVWDARVYAFASYLIGYNPEGKSSFYYTRDEFTLTRLPEWWLRIGFPVDSFADLEQYRNPDFGVYIRRFDHAVVIVNPFGNTTGAIPLGGRYLRAGPGRPIQIANGLAIAEKYDLTFSPVTAISLPAYSAAILMKP